MPYPRTELQAYRCHKWAKDNGYLYDPNGDAFIKVANGYEVAVPLPNDNRDVLATYYHGCGLVKFDIRKSSIPNPYGKTKHCKTAEEAVGVLTSSHEKESTSKYKSNDTAIVTVADKKSSDNCTVRDESNNSISEDETALRNSPLNITAQDTSDNCTDIKSVSDADYAGDRDLIVGEDGKLYRVRVGGEDAGVVDGECRDYENERASFVKIKDACLQSCNPYTTCALTLGTYIRQPFNDIQKAVLKLLKKDKGFLFKNYGNLKCGFMFSEPYANGGFHCHMILCFYDEIPHDLYGNVLKEWKKRIIIPTETYMTDEHLVDMRCFCTVEEFVKYVDYLNPTKGKKRERLKHYPRGRKARQGYGDFGSPNEVVLPAGEAKKLTEHEHIALRHEIKILNASSTIFSGKEDLKYHGFSYYYSTNKDFWNAIIANGQSSCEHESTPPVTAPEPQTTEISVDYNDEDDRDNSGWADYVYEHFTMLHLRC